MREQCTRTNANAAFRSVHVFCFPVQIVGKYDDGEDDTCERFMCTRAARATRWAAHFASKMKAMFAGAKHVAIPIGANQMFIS